MVSMCRHVSSRHMPCLHSALLPMCGSTACVPLSISSVSVLQITTAYPIQRVSSLYADERHFHQLASIMHPSVVARQLRFVCDAWMVRFPKLVTMLSLHKEVCVCVRVACRANVLGVRRLWHLCVFARQIGVLTTIGPYAQCQHAGDCVWGLWCALRFMSVRSTRWISGTVGRRLTAPTGGPCEV